MKSQLPADPVNIQVGHAPFSQRLLLRQDVTDNLYLPWVASLIGSPTLSLYLLAIGQTG